MRESSRRGSAAYRLYRALTHNDGEPSSLWRNALRALVRVGFIVTNPARLRKVVLCLRQERLAVLVSWQPQLPFKYLRRNYLASCLDRGRRAQILTFHFRYIAACFSREAIEAVVRAGLFLWTGPEAARTHRVRLAVPHPVDNEGELALEYLLDDRVIYTLSFTFASPSSFALPGNATVLISRIQANGVNAATLREAAKDVGDIAPRYVLIFAMQGLLLALGQDCALAVSVAGHTISRAHSHAISPASYDDLFDAIGGTRKGEGLYVLPVPFQEHEPTHASSSHRRRARNRRAGRQRITDQVRLAAAALLMSVATPEAATEPADIPGRAADELV